MSLFQNEPQELDIKDGGLIYYESFFDLSMADKLFNEFLKNIKWKQDSINMFGKKIPLPRETAWYGDSKTSYNYSGIDNTPLEWTDTLLEIKNKIESVCENSFNSLLLNKYRNGDDKLSWHADDEPELDEHCSIASLSFGSERTFSIKHKNHKNMKYDFILKHGSLLIMKPPMQKFWLHQVPPRKNITKERINLTYRYVSQL